MEKFLVFLGLVVFVIAVVTGLGLLFAFPVKWLINYLFTKTLLTAIFGVEQVSVWKAFWLNVLIGLTIGRPSTSSASKSND